MNASTVTCFVALAITLLFLVAERLLVAMARRRFKIVIHINGTRGKSTVTRMAHAILREAGYVAWGKTTGTEPRLLLPDGGERLIRRLGPANVREQRDALLRAAAEGAAALAFECNAVRPELQLVSEAYLSADILVITNARLDHELEQGSADEAALDFAATIPRGGIVVSSDPTYRSLWASEAEKRGARFVFVDASEGEGQGDMPENIACALGIADAIGLTRERATKALASYVKDPGAFAESSWLDARGLRTLFLDASAANDPESTDRLARLAYARMKNEENRGATRPYRVLVVATRADRPDRTMLFAEYAVSACLSIASSATRPADAGSAAMYDEAAFLGPLPIAARRILRRSGIHYRLLEKPSQLDTGAVYGAASGSGPERGDAGGSTRGSAYNARLGTILVAAGNRGGHGKRLHDWAVSKVATTPAAIAEERTP